MKGHVVAANPARAMVAIRCEDDSITVAEVIGAADDLELGDLVEGDLWGHGGTTLRHASGSLDVCIEVVDVPESQIRSFLLG